VLPESWTSVSPVRLMVGAGLVDKVPTIVSGRTLIVTTRGATQRGLSSRVAERIGRDVRIHDAVRPNPTIADIDEAIELHRDDEIEWIVGLGGGSSIDVAKVMSLTLADRSRRLGHWFPTSSAWDDIQPIPMVAVPTTAGTGSEVTPFATVWDAETKRKHSVGTPRMFATAAVIDPELTASLPWDVTLSTGLDAYSQCFEASVNRKRRPVTSDIAAHGLTLIPDALRTLRRDPGSLPARTAMSIGALCSGLAISVTRTGLAHSMSYPITAHLGVPHGLACAICLPAVLRFNAESDDGSMEDVANRLRLNGPTAVIASVLELFDDLRVRQAARAMLADGERLRPLAAEMMTADRAANNPRPAGPDDISRLISEIEAWLGMTTRS
jgi:phosphonate metabolism-associated iron-containing alcohol dehydrogenase